MNSETKLIMNLMSKYQIVSLFDDSGFKLSKVFVPVLVSSLSQHKNPLFAILYAIRSFAYEASNEERVVICTHLAKHIISERQKEWIASTLHPMLKKLDKNFKVNPKLYDQLIAKIENDAKYT